MNKRLYCVLALVLLSACTSPANVPEPSPIILPVAESKTNNSLLNCIYFDRELFAQGLSSPCKYELDSAKTLTAGMVPHHLLAADMIAGFFSLAAQQKDSYDTVLLISPSHFPEKCSSDAVTATADWNTPYGILKTDIELVEALLSNETIGAENSSDAVEYDHGAAGLIPFVRYYLPKAKVAVCLLSNKLSQQRLDEIQRVINEQRKDKNILLIASADCSHYLMPHDAEKHDKATAQAIQSFDFAQIMQFSDSNLDSPQAVTTFLSAAQASGAVLKQLDHSSSAQKLPHAISNPIYDEGITTYYVYAAVK